MSVCSVVLISLYSLYYRAYIKDHSLTQCVFPLAKVHHDFSHLISQIAIHPILLFQPFCLLLVVCIHLKVLHMIKMNTFNSKHENLIFLRKTDIALSCYYSYCDCAMVSFVSHVLSSEDTSIYMIWLKFPFHKNADNKKARILFHH